MHGSCGGPRRLRVFPGKASAKTPRLHALPNVPGTRADNQKQISIRNSQARALSQAANLRSWCEQAATSRAADPSQNEIDTQSCHKLRQTIPCSCSASIAVIGLRFPDGTKSALNSGLKKSTYIGAAKNSQSGSINSLAMAATVCEL
jgi:hypothetical protein